ncbi:MAG TPA: hypothetical protein VF979_09930 [Streptosporangiaceae bacterium]
MATGSSGRSNPLGEEWNGTTWTVLSPPTSGKIDSYHGVAGPAASLCVAVGSGYRPSVEQTLIANWQRPTS